MVREVKAPEVLLPYMKGNPRMIFLAGSIDMGEAENWQDKAVKKIQERYSDRISRLVERQILVLNPRRDDWNSSWVQSIYDRNFNEQVGWELEGLTKADRILMNFTKDSKAPITLLELGLFAETNKIIISCHPEFYRRGNVEMVANKFNIPLYDNLEELFDEEKMI